MTAHTTASKVRVCAPEASARDPESRSCVWRSSVVPGSRYIPETAKRDSACEGFASTDGFRSVLSRLSRLGSRMGLVLFVETTMR